MAFQRKVVGQPAVFLGSIRVAAIDTVLNGAERKRVFITLMLDLVADIIEEKTGKRPPWGAPTEAPEHEKAGNG